MFTGYLVNYGEMIRGCVITEDDFICGYMNTKNKNAGGYLITQFELACGGKHILVNKMLPNAYALYRSGLKVLASILQEIPRWGVGSSPNQDGTASWLKFPIIVWKVGKVFID
jgi:hypothetical protein